MFLAIDRILQNINGKISNGIVVGPEFSRMVSEILLQQIDYEVKIILFNKKLFQNKDYSIYRWVDDIYIFANERKDLNCFLFPDILSHIPLRHYFRIRC